MEFYRIKKESTWDWINKGLPPAEDLLPATEEEFLHSPEVVCVNTTEEEFKSLMDRKKLEFNKIDAEKHGFYRMKEGCPFIDEYQRINGTLPWEFLERITEDEFLDGTGKTISYGIPFQEFEAIVRRRESERLIIPT